MVWCGGVLVCFEVFLGGRRGRRKEGLKELCGVLLVESCCIYIFFWVCERETKRNQQQKRKQRTKREGEVSWVLVVNIITSVRLALFHPSLFCISLCVYHYVVTLSLAVFLHVLVLFSVVLFLL